MYKNEHKPRINGYKTLFIHTGKGGHRDESGDKFKIYFFIENCVTTVNNNQKYEVNLADKKISL